MKLTLNIWRQQNARAAGEMRSYTLDGVSEDISFLEMLDMLNEQLIEQGEEPVEFEHDCREGICGSCGLMINGQAHGPQRGTATCQLHMRKFRDGETINIEPWRAAAFPVVKDLVVDRSAFDRIVEAGGYITAPTGSAPDANLIPVPKDAADAAFDAAACPNSAAQLFTSAKIEHLNLLPQGQAERDTRVLNMVDEMETYFGSCTNHGECTVACPKDIPLDYIAYMNRDYVRAQLRNRKLAGQR